MRGNKCRDVSVPTTQQNCGAPVIEVGQTESAIFLWHFDSKSANLRESLEIFWRNFAGAIDLVRLDMLAQIILKLAQEFFAGRAIFGALRWIRINPIEIVATDEEITGKTTAIFERVARRLGQLQRFALFFAHL